MKYKILQQIYINNKLKIFPIQENAKTPLIPNWQNDCSYDKLQISYWIENLKNCNWGLPCSPNDLFVLDIDVHTCNGYDSLINLLNDVGLTKDDLHTLKQITPSGGMHIIFKSDEDLKKVLNTSNSFKDYPGIDIRTDGYIVVFPSTIDGKKYRLNDEEINVMPLELKNFILSQRNINKENKEKKEYTKPEKVEKGNRDTELFTYINYLYYHTRLSDYEIEVLAEDFNNNICEEPLPTKTVKYKVKKVFEKDRGKCIYIKLDCDN